MRLLWLSLLCILPQMLHAQTISPLFSEYKNKAHGEFSITNNQIKPLIVTLSAQALGSDLSLKDDKSFNLKLSEYSARIPAQQTHTFTFEMTCVKSSCAAVILASMITGHTVSGVQVISALGHTVYVCPTDHCRSEFLAQAHQ